MAIDRKRNNFRAGYFTSESPLDETVPKNALVYPSLNMLYDHNSNLRNFNGFSWSAGGGDSTFYLDNGWASMGNHHITDTGSGNVFEYYNKSLIFVGSGVLKAFFPSVNAAIQTIGVASSIPQIAVLNEDGDGWEVPKQLGLAQQGISPIISVPVTTGVGFSRSLIGVRSSKISAVRSSTGGISNASPASNVVEFAGSSALYDMPPARTDGSDKWRIYFTPSGFGNVGFFLQVPVEILESEVAAGTVNIVQGNTRIVSTAVSRQLEIEFDDSELLDLQAPDDQFPASDASFVSAIGNVVLLLGTFKGVGISASNPNQAEAFPPSNASFISEKIVGISRPASGFLYVLAQNSIWLAMMSGAVMGGTPVIARSFLNNVGVKNHKATVTIGDDLYLFSSGGKAVRVSAGGQIDMKFGDKVSGIFQTWNPANVSVSHDDINNKILFCHDRTILSYEIDYDRWNTPIEMQFVNGVEPNGTITSAFTKDGKMNVVYWHVDDEEYKIGIFGAGTEGSGWIIREAWDSWNDYRVTKDMIYVSAMLKIEDATEENPVTINGEIYKNYEETSNYVFAFTINNSGMEIIPKTSVRSYFMNVSSVQLNAYGYGHTLITFDEDVDIHNIA